MTESATVCTACTKEFELLTGTAQGLCWLLMVDKAPPQQQQQGSRKPQQVTESKECPEVSHGLSRLGAS
jgi:hypothetical protein